MLDPKDTDPGAETDPGSKLVTLGLIEHHDGMAGVSFTITSLNDGIQTIHFTEDEMDKAWRAMQHWYFKVEAENHSRRIGG